jgi:hypothetical protein
MGLAVHVFALAHATLRYITGMAVSRRAESAWAAPARVNTALTIIA